MPLIAYYPNDEASLKNLTHDEFTRFEKWFAELNEENLKRDNTFYSGEPLEKGTGIFCWYSSFKDGLTPVEALDEDLTNA